MQDNLLRQRDGVYQLQDNLLRQRDSIFQLQDNMLQQLSQIEFDFYKFVENCHDKQWMHRIEKMTAIFNRVPAEVQGYGIVLNMREIQESLLPKALAMSAAAQEAAQQPALRLWNASTGLNQAATGALVAMSNQGTRTQTTTQSSGGFLGGVFSSGLASFAGGFGVATGNGLFGGK